MNVRLHACSERKKEATFTVLFEAASPMNEFMYVEPPMQQYPPNSLVHPEAIVVSSSMIAPIGHMVSVGVSRHIHSCIGQW